MATTLYFLWSRNQGTFRGPFPSSADATTAGRDVATKSNQAGGLPGHFAADQFDVVTVTKN